jgi:hypothetical protein
MKGAVWLRLEILTMSFLICHSGAGYDLMPGGPRINNRVS